MLGKELAEIVMSGARPAVTFLPSISEAESVIDPGMRGRVVSVNDDGDGVLRFQVDLREFESHNLPLSQRNYYDSRHVPCLTAREAGCWTDDETVYVGATAECPMAIENDARLALYEQFRLSGAPNYLQWLEDRVLATTKSP